MNSPSYTKLLELKKAGKLRVISLVAPARSSSTALERALLESPSIDLQVNDPWGLYDDAGREDKAYEYIATRLEEIADRPSKTLLIKNVADDIAPGTTWGRWNDLITDHIFLVRNPLLTMQSLFRILPLHYTGEQMVIAPMTLDEYSRARGFNDWKALQKRLTTGDNFSDFGDLYYAFFIQNQKIHRDPSMYVPVLQMVGPAVAKDAGFADYEDLKKKIFATTDYKPFEAVLERAFAYRITGWEALWQHFLQTLGIAKPSAVTVLDSTMFRADPEKSLRFICKRLGVEFTKGMYEWEESSGKNFTTDYDGDVPYYDRVMSAVKIEPPTEPVIPPEAFPSFFTHHLTGEGGAFEIYLLMLAKMEKPYLKDFKLTDSLRDIDPVFAAAFDNVKKALK